MGVQDPERGLRAARSETSTGFAAGDIAVEFGKTQNRAAACGCSARALNKGAGSNEVNPSRVLLIEP